MQGRSADLACIRRAPTAAGWRSAKACDSRETHRAASARSTTDDRYTRRRPAGPARDALRAAPVLMPAVPRNDLRTELAAAAARLIAEEGLDYARAKRKAALDLYGPGTRCSLPDNESVERELRRYLTTFEADALHDRLAALRSLALALMARLEHFEPHLVGAVLNGTATAHSDIHLHLFTDSAKEVELFLLDAGIAFDVDAANAGRDPSAPVEEMRFVLPGRSPALPARVGVVLSVHDADAIRVAPKSRSSDPALHPVEASGRAGARALRSLIEHAERSQ